MSDPSGYWPNGLLVEICSQINVCLGLGGTFRLTRHAVVVFLESLTGNESTVKKYLNITYDIWLFRGIVRVSHIKNTWISYKLWIISENGLQIYIINTSKIRLEYQGHRSRRRNTASNMRAYISRIRKVFLGTRDQYKLQDLW